jgi:hypothetical protein
MAEKGWTAQIAAAAGVAAGTGAAQLGLGYGLGVIIWPVTISDDNSVWLGSLGWATWIAASATVFGAVIASRLSSRTRGLWRFALAVAAAVGAVVTVALVALPARDAVRIDTFAPETIAAGYSIIGILLGVVLAYWAVASRPVAANLIATAAWLWALAVAAIVVDLVWHRPTATYLSSWQFAGPSLGARYGTIYWPSSVLTLLAALVIGVIAVWPAVRRGEFGVGAATSGAVGPLLVAGAFFALAPQLTGTFGPLESAYLIAPYAVLAGLAGSAMTVAIGRSAAQRRSQQANRIPRDAQRAALESRRQPPGATGVATVPATDAIGRSGPLAAEEEPTARPRAKGRLRHSGASDETSTDPATGVGATSRPAADRPLRSSSSASDTTSTGPAADAGATSQAVTERPRAKGWLRRRSRDSDSAPTASPAGGGESSAAKSASPQQPPRAATAARPEAAKAARSNAAGNSAKSKPAGSAQATPPPRSAAPATKAQPASSSPRPMQPPPVAPAPTQGPPNAPAPVSPAKSTVAPPPVAPPVAKINPSVPDANPAPRKAPAKKPPRRPTDGP